MSGSGSTSSPPSFGETRNATPLAYPRPMEQTWEWIADERRMLADLVEGLDEAQLATPSLCAGWAVRDVFAHLALSLDPSPGATLRAAVRSGFRMNRAIQALTADAAQRSTPELVELFRSRADHHWNPPGFGPSAPLTDLLVHGVDLRRPLGLDHAPDPDALRAALDFVTTTKAGFGFTDRGNQRGLRFEASDLEWADGSGPAVRGPGLPLLVAMCGRPAVLDELSGEGVAELRTRLA